jgi:hypothetical protein
VDDGSPDGTQDIVKQLQKVYGEDRVVSIFNSILLWSEVLLQCLTPGITPATAS